MSLAGPGQLNLDDMPVWGSRSLEDSFEKLAQIGEGTYGSVLISSLIILIEELLVYSIVVLIITSCPIPNFIENTCLIWLIGFPRVVVWF